jgi:hypothetical protein
MDNYSRDGSFPQKQLSIDFSFQVMTLLSLVLVRLLILFRIPKKFFMSEVGLVTEILTKKIIKIEHLIG